MAQNYSSKLKKFPYDHTKIFLNTKRMLPVWLQVRKKRSLMTTQNRVFFTTQMNAVEL